MPNARLTTTQRAAYTNRVTRHLRDNGFSGYTDIDTNGQGHDIITVIARNPRAVPWTPALHNWLRLALNRLPGATVRSINQQVIHIIWANPDH